MRKWDYVLIGTLVVLIATGVIMMIGGQIFGGRTTSVTSAIGLLGIFIMLFASRKAAARKARK
jgi:predicted membrane channel-forming protein YqfA (hemolysin III family)